MARQFRGGGSRRKTQWGGFGSSAGGAALEAMVALSADVSTIISRSVVIGGGLGIVDEEFTVTRMIGALTASLNVDTAVAAAGIAIGCAVVRNEALVAGVASLPSVEDDPDFEWLYYGVHGVRNQPVSGLQSEVSTVRRMFDVRGQRVLRTGYSVAWLAESQNTNCFIQVGGRYLVKLP